LSPDPCLSCPFCELAGRDLVVENDLAAAFRDGFPVNPGHTLIVPRRHISTWFDATAQEQVAILELAAVVKTQLDAELHPDGYNLGLNAGEAAGQTVPHLHLHVIPRFRGDVDDPTGGVRFVIPTRGNYRRGGFIPTAREIGGARAQPLAVGGPADPFLAHLVPLFARADDIAILAAFVQDSGVQRLEPYILSALERGARVRLLTGDYLNITQAHALRRVLDLGRGAAGEGGASGSLELRVVEVDGLGGGSQSFHPKSWLFLGRDLGSAFVGSSNVSRSALGAGIEWNLRVDRARDPDGFARVVSEFVAWWARATAVDDAWVDAYDRRSHADAKASRPGEIEEDTGDLPAPRDVQLEALEALRKARAEGRQRALVVFATGLGKTWLAVLDAWRFAEQLGRRPRILFLAHRAEILQQAAATFRGLFREERFGWYLAEGSDLSGDLVFASVQKLARRENLTRVAPDAFDYVVVDEVHHADAETYRRILGHLKPGFLLGLTATPERADAGDIFGLFDDFVAHRADLGVGIELGHLVPFRYFGLKDTADYQPIPWKNGRFDSDRLAAAVETQARMERLWQGWREHPGTRTLVFCCSIPHAHFAADWLAERGVRVAAVHSGPESADRAEALWRLGAGELDALCAVDLFNEGIDVPMLDRVVMLRPTESPVVFLQQLGRGLRTAEGKTELQVIDFVGNHRVFLDRVRTLLSLSEKGKVTSIQDFLERGQAPDLPAGCSVEIELEAVDLLRKLLPTGGDRLELVRAYRDLRASRGRRPTAGELFRMGYNPRSLQAHGSWFEFVRAQGDLQAEEAAALDEAGPWLEAVERRETMTRSYKMVALEALLDAEALQSGTTVEENARRSYEILRRSPELFADLRGTRELPDPENVPEVDWAAYWQKWPLAHWAGEGRRAGERAWFRLAGGHFEPTFSVRPELVDALARMTRELVDYRLARYRRTKQQEAAGERGAFEAKVISNQRDPILILPDRKKAPGLPAGDTDVRLPDGTFWRFRFVKVAVNVAHPVGSSRNELPDLLRRWFGPDAGKPGTSFSVRFAPSPDGWWAEPVAGARAEVIPFPARGRFVSFPTLKAAAGWEEEARTGEALEPEEVALPGDFDREKTFAVRASGTSMEGWKFEIRDGDWLVMTWARGQGLPTLKGRVVLVGRGDPVEGQTYHVKKVVKTSEGYVLHSDNSEVDDKPAEPFDQVIAVLAKSLRPEDLAPQPGTRLQDDELAAAFGLSGPPRGPWSRVDGHLFLLLEGEGSLSAPDRVPQTVPHRHPGETAFVLGRGGAGEPWRYLGVGRWGESDRAWLVQGAGRAD
jgi:superfamily II DNA or RNA helicase/diadenosine tetraphosphate (Ap4A) HIT family hydrolase/HKD family nuclease